MVQKKKIVILLFIIILHMVLAFQTAHAYSGMTLKMGMENSEVKMLQRDLRRLGFMEKKPTGYFGKITKTAVKKFQKRYGLEPDGLAGAKTFRKIDGLLGRSKSSSRGYSNRSSITYTKVDKQWASRLPQRPYNKGVGMYEGVVMHYTDNPNDTAQREADNVKNNDVMYFVHEYIDSRQVIQVANPNYYCWGAGLYANRRFVQIELCHASTRAEFKKSFTLYCKRAAEYLYDRKLGVTPAKADGTGTLWSHADITKYIGGTNHTDPIDYLAKWGKTWQDVIGAVRYDYNKLKAADRG